MGATRLLQLQPGLIRDMLHAMRTESVCPANAGLLEAVLGSLRHECMESAGALGCPPHCTVLGLDVRPGSSTQSLSVTHEGGACQQQSNYIAADAACWPALP